MEVNQENDRFPLRFSLFHGVPPFLRIIEHGKEYAPSLPEELSLFTMLAPSGISPIIVKTIKAAGFNVVQGPLRNNEETQVGAVWDCLPITEKTKDEINFDRLNYQSKINQFPGLFIIGRKDQLWISYKKMQDQFGSENFNFLPLTYILPRDKEELIRHMEKKPQVVWILKPPNWFCGIGISLINSKEEIPEKKNVLCVQEYIDRPLLIKGLKFDLRLYVLLTSLDPIRVYIYEEGLVRFATQEYSNSPEHLKNTFIHLTNYSVNKNNEEFVHNTHPGEFEGHKWNLKTLWRYFEEKMGIDWRPIWEKTKDICTKTVLCGHEHMGKAYNKNIKSEYNCYKLFGFDVFYDVDLKPWILEVNNIPSLHINDIDAFVNYPMIAEMFTMIGFHYPRDIGFKYQRVIAEKLGMKKSSNGLGISSEYYTREKSKSEQEKIDDYEDCGNEPDETILEDLTPWDLRVLMHSEDEFAATDQWTRMMPSKDQDYLQFLTHYSYSDKLLGTWELKYGASKQSRKEGIKFLQEMALQDKHKDPSKKKRRSQVF